MNTVLRIIWHVFMNNSTSGALINAHAYGYPKTAEIYVHDLGGETVGEVFEEDLEGDPVGESVRIDSLEDIEIPVGIDGGLGGNVC